MELAEVKPGDEVKIAIEHAVAAGMYGEASGSLILFRGRSQMAGHPVRRNSEELVDYLRGPGPPPTSVPSRRTSGGGDWDVMTDQSPWRENPANLGTICSSPIPND